MSQRWALAPLLALIALNVYLKVYHSTLLPRFDPDDELGYYKVESAYQYRYARMIAEGAPVPEVDIDAQYPEGVRVTRELTMAMERATGWCWRLWPSWLPKPAFPQFVILWVSVVSSLSLISFYAILLMLTGDAGVALAASACYGLSWAAISDLIGTYGFQCLALPLIFAGIAFFIAALKAGKPFPLAVAAGLAWAAALGSWHVTRFILASFFLAGFYAVWRADTAARERFRTALAVVLAFALGAGLAFPVLRESRFALSPTMALGLALLAYLTLRGKRLIACLAALAVLPWLLGQGAPESAAYGHAYGLLIEKLRHALIKPADPSRLDWEARLLWVGPFNSPELGFMVFSALPLAFLALFRLAGPGKERTPAASLIDGMALLYILGTAAVVRLLPIAAFFFCLAAVRRIPAGKTLMIAAVASLAALESLKTSFPYSRRNPIMWLSAPLTSQTPGSPVLFQNERAMLEWLKDNAGPGKPVLAHYGISGPILAYTASPTLLNPKGESFSSRAKSMEYLRALYSDEEGFHRFCRKYGARYVVYTTGNVLDESRQGTRYDAAHLKLNVRDAAVRLHFFPESLKRFRLVYQNMDYRIFSTDERDRAIGPPADPIYEIGRYDAKTAPDGTLTLDVAGVLARIGESRRHLYLARLFARMGRREQAILAYEKAFELWPPDAAVRRETEQFVTIPP